MYLVCDKYLLFTQLWSLEDIYVGFIFINWDFRDRILGLGCLRHYLWQRLGCSSSCGKQSQETLAEEWGGETGKEGAHDHWGPLEFSPAGVLWVTMKTMCLRVPTSQGFGVFIHQLLSVTGEGLLLGAFVLWPFLPSQHVGTGVSDAPRPGDSMLTLGNGACIHWHGKRQEEISRVLAASATKYPLILLVSSFSILQKIVFCVCRSAFYVSVVGKVYKRIRKYTIYKF